MLQKPSKPKSRVIRILLTVFICLIILVGIVSGYYFVSNMQDADAIKRTANTAIITSSPFDLDQITAMTKFRSCEGHDFSGNNFAYGQEPESSMKHYVTFDSNLNTEETVKLFAPFDGKINDVGQPEDGQRGIFIELRPTTESGYFLEFGHVAIKSGLKKGDNVKAGDLVGYAVPGNGQGNTFDLEFGYHNSLFTKYTDNLDSPLNHMTSEVSALFDAVGFTKDSSIFTKEYREQNPCKLSGTKSKSDDQFASSDDQMKTDIVVSNRAPAGSLDASTTQTGSPDNASPSNNTNNQNDACNIAPGQSKPPGCK